MIDPDIVRIQDGHAWLRVADSSWSFPLDPTFAKRRGGRWNPPRSHDTLYLNEDVETARAQIHKMLEGSPVRPEDLEDTFVLVAATLPSHQDVADASTDHGLDALGLPPTYPVDAAGTEVPHSECQPIGSDVKDLGLRGVYAKSAATHDGSGRELAWFPARRSSRATAVGDPIDFDQWWYNDISQ